jgi:polyisoprenoid-binding protein YceI
VLGLRVAALLSALAGAATAVPPVPSAEPVAPATTDVPTTPMPLLFDPAASHAQFRVRLRILPSATGHFLDVRGELQPDGAKQRVAVEVDGRKLRFEGPAWMGKVTRSKDFLAVEEHPQIRFVSASFAPKLLRDGGELRGELTLRGTARPVTFRVQKSACPEPGRDCEIVVTGRVSRQAFGMTAYRISVRDGVEFEFRVRLLPEPAP